MGKARSTSSSDSESETSSSEEERRRRKRKKKHQKKSYKSTDKKAKKKKHRKRKEYSNSSSGSESGEEEWVVKESRKSEDPLEFDKDNVEEPKIESQMKPKPVDDDQDWMDIVPTFSNEGKKAKRRIEKEEERSLKSMDKPGQHVRELNPYWKQGGTGLPSDHDENQTTESPKPFTMPVSSVGDGGLSWLKKSYQRAKEQAKEQNKSIEEIAEERWGSLNNFFEMLEKAEAIAKKNSESSSSRHGENRGRRDGRDDHRDHRRDDRRERSFKRPARDSESDDDVRYSHRHRRPADSSSSSRRRSRERGRNSEPSWRKNTAPCTSTSLVSSSKTERSLSPSPLLREEASERPVRRQSPETRISPEIKDEQKQEEEVAVKVLTDTEMNALNAKILKAELMGNDDLLAELRTKLADATKQRDNYVKNGPPVTNEPKIITKVVVKSGDKAGGRRLTNKPTETHKDGQRVRYFPDDDRQTLQKMFEKEKLNTAEDENALFSRLAGRKGTKTTDEYDLDDEFADKASSSKKVQKEKESEVRNIVRQEKDNARILENCEWCFSGKRLQRNIVVASGEKSYLCVPPFQSLTEGHCLIVPMHHASSTIDLDEDVWEEMQKFKSAVVKMFLEDDQDTVIFETVTFIKSLPHMYLECVPMPKETGELAPIYFKKAIQECETEWAQNKKLIDLRGRSVRRSVPKGLPYFSVDFGLDPGFAHVIENEREFPKNFAQEIIGGMMELDHQIWRKRTQDNFKIQKEKILNFLKIWKPFDWTKESSTSTP